MRTKQKARCNGDATRSCVKGIGYQLLNGLVWTYIQTFGEETRDSVTQPNINLLGFIANGRVYGICHEINIPAPRRTHLRTTLKGRFLFAYMPASSVYSSRFPRADLQGIQWMRPRRIGIGQREER
ncbi:MAG: hypothetical protein ABSD59_21240 [Terracidiphilus sp.]|jgi:hypothetical protein